MKGPSGLGGTLSRLKGILSGLGGITPERNIFFSSEWAMPNIHVKPVRRAHSASGEDRDFTHMPLNAKEGFSPLLYREMMGAALRIGRCSKAFRATHLKCRYYLILIVCILCYISMYIVLSVVGCCAHNERLAFRENA